MVIGVVVLLLCAAPIGVLALGGGGHRSGATAVFHPPSPSPTPMSPESYQSLLSTLDTQLASRVQALANAKTIDDVGRAATAVGETADSSLQPLRIEPVPAAVQAANNRFVNAMTSLAQTMVRLSDPCSGAIAMVDLTNGDLADLIRAASKALATADPAHPYHVGAFLPPPVAKFSSTRPGNGAVLKHSGGSSHGEMTVKNQSDKDVTISLVPQNSNSAAVVFYVYAQQEAKYTSVHDGTYQVFVADGSVWNADTKAFARDCTFSKMDGTEQYTTTSTQYMSWTLTLQVAGSGGNVSDTPVDPGSFPN